MPVSVQCAQCGKTKSVIPARAATFKFCSVRCRSEWRKVHFVGAGNPRWQGGERVKACQRCGAEYGPRPNQPHSTFVRSKFCSKSCADAGGFRLAGEAHPNWAGGRSKRSRGYRRWAQAVISRDGAKCMHCGASGTELHAHHLKPWKQYPALRFDVANGITLCAQCHWAVHSATNENGVNSGETAAGQAGGNPEPSPNGNIREGVTTRGRAYRRWEGPCDWCGRFISKRLSDAKPLGRNFCSKSCAGKHRFKHGQAFVHGGNAPTSAPRESEDIV